jgi:hypothetical protein
LVRQEKIKDIIFSTWFREINIFKKANWDQIKTDIIDLCPRIIQSKTSVEEKWTELKNEINNTLDLNVPKELIPNRHNLPWLSDLMYFQNGLLLPSSSADYIVYCLHNSSELVLQPFALHAFEACIYPSFLFFLSS